MRINIQTIKDNMMKLQGGNDEVHELVAKILQTKFGSFPIVLGEIDLPVIEGMECTYSVINNIDYSLFTVIKNRLKNSRVVLLDFEPKG